MKRYICGLFLTFCVYAALLSLGSSRSFALDPKFELDAKALGSKKQCRPKDSEAAVEGTHFRSIQKKNALYATTGVTQ